MRAVIQRVTKASVQVNSETVGQISQGLCCLIGIETDDTTEDMNYIVKKITTMRLFESYGKSWNASVVDINGGLLCISQFTLLGRIAKGTRPDFSRAMKGSESSIIYDNFLTRLRSIHNGPVENGIFGAMMTVEIINDGPVTITIDSRNKQ